MANKKSQSRGAAFADDMREDPNMGMNPYWRAKNPNKTPEKLKPVKIVIKGKK